MRGNIKVYQKKIVKKKRRKNIILISSISFAFVFLIFLFSYLSHLDFFKIKNFDVIGNEKISKSEIENIVKEKISGKYLFLFSKKNIFIYPKKAIEKSMLELSTIKEVDIDMKGLNSLIINVVELKEVAIFCQGDFFEKDFCFFVDDTGFIFKEIKEESFSEELVIYRNYDILEPVKKHVIDSGVFKKINFFKSELDKMSLKTKEIMFGRDNNIMVILADGGKLIINSSDELSDVLSNISSVIFDKGIVNNLDVFLKNLDYIVLNSGNKVFYKLKK